MKLPSKKTMVDLADRCFATFGQAFLAYVVVHKVGDVAALEAAGAAGGLALAKFLLVKANAFLSAPDASK